MIPAVRYPILRTGRRARVLLACLPPLLHATASLAVTATWTPATPGRWLDPSHWSSGAVPTSSDPVAITLPGSPYTVTVDAPASSGPLTVDNPDATLLLQSAAAADLTFSPGNINIAAGSLTLRQRDFDELNIGDYTNANRNLSVGAAGRLDLYASAQSFNRVYSRIHGNVTNAGAILAHADPSPRYGFTASFQFASGTFTNTGVVRAEPGARLSISSSTFNQNAGSLSGNILFTGSTFNFNGGSVDTVGLSSAYLRFAPSATGGVFAAIVTNVTTHLTTAIPAGNTFYVTPGSKAWWAASSLTNAGNLVLNRPSPIGVAAFDPYAETGTFSDVSSRTITNNGTLDIDSPGYWPAPLNFDLVNNGVVNYDKSYNPPNRQPTPAGNWTNNGSVTIAAGANVRLYYRTFTQNPGATLTTNNALTLLYSDFYFSGGATAGGTVSLGDASTLHLNVTPGGDAAGHFTFTGATGTLAGDVPANTTILLAPDAHSATVTVSAPVPFSNAGTVDLRPGATLSVNYTGPSPATALRTQLLTGHLTSSAAAPSLRLGYLDTGTAVLVTLTPTGDADLDGTVNADDYTLLDRAYARALSDAHWQDGDFNYDGAVDASDYLLIDTTLGHAQGFSPGFLSTREQQFGAAYVSQLLTNIPEPSTLLAACGLALLPLTRPRRPHTPAT